MKGPDQIRTLVPGQEWRTFWDSTIHREELEMPPLYTATVSFKDSRDKQLGPYTFELDWEQIMDRGWIETYGMHQLADAIREIRGLLKEWKGTGNAMRVLAYSGEKHDEQEREFWAKRRDERKERSRQKPNGDSE